LKALKGDASAFLVAASLYLFCSEARVTVSLRCALGAPSAGEDEWCQEEAW